VKTTSEPEQSDATGLGLGGCAVLNTIQMRAKKRHVTEAPKLHASPNDETSSLSTEEQPWQQHPWISVVRGILLHGGICGVGRPSLGILDFGTFGMRPPRRYLYTRPRRPVPFPE
jgi:hypothetical protein